MSLDNLEPKEIAKYIDHTCVKVDATDEDIKKICEEAIKYGFHSVCVTPTRVKTAKKYLDNNKTAIIAVVGFPFGFTTNNIKAGEAYEAVENGATEIDMVININNVKDSNWDLVEKDITSVVKAVNKIGVKVIMETGFLTKDELYRTCLIAEKAGAKFVKTATGYGPRGAELHDITIMKSAIGNRIGIKASGGIHDFETALVMLKAGASRIGSSSGLEIIGVKDKFDKKNIKLSYNY